MSIKEVILKRQDHFKKNGYDLSIQILGPNWLNANKLMAFFYNTRNGLLDAPLPSIENFSQINDNLNDSAIELISSLKKGASRKDLPKILTDPEKGLASNGYYALNQIFRHEVIDYINHSFPESRVPIIEIISDFFVIPWEWLFDDHPKDYSEMILPSMVKPFWGFNRIVARSKYSDHIVDCHPLQTTLPAPFKIGVIIDNKLKYARDEQDWLISATKNGKIIVEKFIYDQKGDEWDFIRAMNVFLNREDIDIFHFACEAEVDPDHPLNSCLYIGNGNKYYMKYFQSDPKVNFKSSLIFLNACSTGARNPKHTFNIVDQFYIENTSSVIAIESNIHSHVANNFAQNFYTNLMLGDSLGISLYKARNEIVKEGDRPEDIVSLFYSLYGQPYLQIGISP